MAVKMHLLFTSSSPKIAAIDLSLLALTFSFFHSLNSVWLLHSPNLQLPFNHLKHLYHHKIKFLFLYEIARFHYSFHVFPFFFLSSCHEAHSIQENQLSNSTIVEVWVILVHQVRSVKCLLDFLLIVGYNRLNPESPQITYDQTWTCHILTYAWS